MNNKIEITVIVVTYNQAETIGRTLDSILSQETDASFEIVIGDDCSTDKSEAICRKYAAQYPEIIKYYRRDRNMGVVKNYFQCIEDAHGNYLTDCAGDDYWIDSSKLQRQYEIMKKNPEVSLIHTDWRYVDKDCKNIMASDLFRNIDRDKMKIYEPWELTKWILNHDPRGMIHLCTAMYRRDMILEELRKNPELFISDDYRCEDFQILIALSTKGKIVYLPGVTLHYSVYEGSISHDIDPEKIFWRVKGNLLIAERMRKHYGIDSENMKEYYFDQLQYLSAQVLHSGKKALCLEYKKLKNILPPTPRSLKLIIKELIITYLSWILIK